MLLKWAVVFLVLAVLSGFFGYGRLSRFSFGIAKVLAFVFVVVFVLLLLAELIRQ